MERNGWTFDLAMPDVVRLALPPYVRGVDWFVRSAAKIKGISSETMTVSFDESFFIGCDACLSGPERSCGGWIYLIEGESVPVEPGTKMWVCDSMRIYFEEAPNKIYVSLSRLN